MLIRLARIVMGNRATRFGRLNPKMVGVWKKKPYERISKHPSMFVSMTGWPLYREGMP
jgi:hypothetical protein